MLKENAKAMVQVEVTGLNLHSGDVTLVLPNSNVLYAKYKDLQTDGKPYNGPVSIFEQGNKTKLPDSNLTIATIRKYAKNSRTERDSSNRAIFYHKKANCTCDKNCWPRKNKGIYNSRGEEIAADIRLLESLEGCKIAKDTIGVTGR